MFFLNKWFNRNKLTKRGMYSVEYGDKSGCFLVYISEENILTGLAFLVIPDLEVIFLSKEDVENHLSNDGLVYVEKLPRPVYEVCKANFKWAKQKTVAI